MAPKLEITENHLTKIYEHACQGYPDEVCGFVFGKIQNGQRQAKDVMPARNIQNELHAKEPNRFTRTAQTAYVIDPLDEKRAKEYAEKSGLAIVSIYHSHPDHGTYFSEEDKTNAAPWGEPFFPDVSYLVVSVYNRQIRSSSDFRWDAEKNDFVEDIIIKGDENGN